MKHDNYKNCQLCDHEGGSEKCLVCCRNYKDQFIVNGSTDTGKCESCKHNHPMTAEEFNTLHIGMIVTQGSINSCTLHSISKINGVCQQWERKDDGQENTM